MNLKAIMPTRWRRAGRRLAGIGLGLTALAGASGAPPLDDGPGGMTCDDYFTAADLRWLRKGGDWRDARGTLHGERAFAETRVAMRSGRQRLTWDVSDLAKRWYEGLQPAGAMLLRGVDTGAAGIVNLRSREHAAQDDAPRLELEWSDGTREQSRAVADTFLACSTRSSSGRSVIMKVGDGQSAAIVFALPPRRDRTLRSAQLLLVADRVYRAGLTVGVYHLAPPSGQSSEVKQGLAQAFHSDIGIQVHPDVLFVDRFEPGRKAAAWSGQRMADENTIEADAENHFEALDGRALRVTIPQGVNMGLNAHYRFARHGGEPDEAFFRYYLRLGESWNPARDGGKLPGFSGTYGRGGWGSRRSDGSNGWSARGAFFRQAAGGSEAAQALRGIGSYVYYADREGDSGAVWGWGLGPTGLLEKNRWYSVEQQLKLNRPGSSDGELRAWVDGHLVFERTGLRFRDVPTLKVESLWMNVYHGGTAKAPADMTLYIDNLVIARSYIGPAGGRR